MQTQFNLQVLENTADTGRFVIEPLPQGYGHTLGNSLRRVLYSSIKGAAITQVRIEGASHQFATIEGVQEDVVQIVLNLKKISLSYTGDEPVKISLSVKGKSEVTASDFELPALVKIANPDLVIAHLATKSTNFEIEAVVESGFGYSPAEDHKTNTVGFIPVDAVFTPVVRVNYSVEATRVGRMTNFDKLILEIMTNGSVSPKSALESSARELVEYFSAIVNPSAVSSTQASTQSSGSSTQVLSVEELDLPTRITNALQKAGLNNVGDLQAMTLSELSKVKNLGGKSAKVIEEALNSRGYSLS